MPLPSGNLKKSQSVKGKKKAKKKEEEARRKAEEDEQEENEIEFQKAVLEIRVNELETLNLGLKRKCDYLESQNSVYKVQLKELKEEKEDLVSYLERSLKGEKTIVKELEDRLIGMQQTYVDFKKAQEKVLRKRDDDFENMKAKLEKRILELGSQLSAVEEFLEQKADLKKKYEELEKKLKKEEEDHAKKYEDLENKTILFTENLKKESVETLISIAKDIQKTARKSLPSSVKEVISQNIQFKNDLETVSKDNLELRARLKKFSSSLKDASNELSLCETKNNWLQHQLAESRIQIKFLSDKNSELATSQSSKSIKIIEEKLSKLEKAHSLCKTDAEISEIIDQTLIEFNETKLEVIKRKEIDAGLRKEIQKLQDVILKVALTAKEMTEANSKEEYEYLWNRFKISIIRAHEVASDFELLPDMKSRLVVSIPKILPYLKF